MRNPKYYNTFFAAEGGSIPEPFEGDDSSPADEHAAFSPKTRREHFISAIADNPNAKQLPPKTRWEYFMARIDGREIPEGVYPMTREEYMLAQFVGDGDSSDQHAPGVIDGGIDNEAPSEWV